ncbi:hypothetical protein Astex_3204 [Asticcacaulis excentricus CB 48]|uniref:Uncharacterized protein n=1 Tax=Asticcacaulis excentricus (strain ATCC 15261 / DSM 4724 / KCTC 12464 / NCIMB 9791 / VKM B-1370 / CB 48) TaxID=573065 RepID=E8RTL8_ASTEC|nr:hypothetical protein Astex_3204 [Asticcacaulis excentricus CB 48]
MFAQQRLAGMLKKNRNWLFLILAVIAFLLALFVLAKVSIPIDLPTSTRGAR